MSKYAVGDIQGNYKVWKKIKELLKPEDILYVLGSAMDYGEDALYDTIQSFHSAKTIGAGSFEDAYKIVVNNINGIRIGFIAISQFEFGIIDNINTRNTPIRMLLSRNMDMVPRR